MRKWYPLQQRHLEPARTKAKEALMMSFPLRIAERRSRCLFIQDIACDHGG